MSSCRRAPDRGRSRERRRRPRRDQRRACLLPRPDRVPRSPPRSPCSFLVSSARCRSKTGLLTIFATIRQYGAAHGNRHQLRRPPRSDRPRRDRAERPPHRVGHQHDVRDVARRRANCAHPARAGRARRARTAPRSPRAGGVRRGGGRDPPGPRRARGARRAAGGRADRRRRQGAAAGVPRAAARAARGRRPPRSLGHERRSSTRRCSSFRGTTQPLVSSTP